MNIYLDKIRELADSLGERKVTIMEVCGGHTGTIMKYGIRDILPSNVRLISGPGCPVCVTAQSDIDGMVALAKKGIAVATYADMMSVPGTGGSLADAKAGGADVAMIVTSDEMLRPENRDRVFFGIGFETTAPMTAYLLQEGIVVYSVHKVMIPPMKVLIETSKIDGFIDPGHVSCIIGSDVWSELGVPQVISGFRPDQILRAVYKLLELICAGKNEVVNDYDEVVHSGGNKIAQGLMKKYMKVYDAEWRGVGVIPGSGLEPVDDDLNARVKYSDLLKDVKTFQNTACRCGDILQGKCEPADCALFGKACTPKSPVGACMVSESEGACGIAFEYR